LQNRSIVLVGGSIAANYLNGGIAWERLSWALGLRKLGFDVFVVDQLDLGRCVFSDGIERRYENCLNRAYFEQITKQFGLADSAVLVGEQGEVLYGPSFGELLELAEAATMLVNVAGNLRLEEVKRHARLKVYVDVDPGLTQLWLESGDRAPRIEGHDLYFTIGENVGTPGCNLPTTGLNWRHTRQPVLLDEWPVSKAGSLDRFTTVATWRGAGPHGHIEHLGFKFEKKADEFAKVIDLPRRAQQTFELALRMRSSDEPDRAMLERYGWRVIDPTTVASNPDSFRRYVQTSGAEFSVAKGAYAETWSGWFSDRTTRYLASGKPALVQDTGFGRSIPVGEGLVAFRTLDEAVQGAERIAADYVGHCQAARGIAEQWFDSDKVLARFVEEVGAARVTQNRRADPG
jgi:hypothetical protein